MNKKSIFLVISFDSPTINYIKIFLLSSAKKLLYELILLRWASVQMWPINGSIGSYPCTNWNPWTIEDDTCDYNLTRQKLLMNSVFLQYYFVLCKCIFFNAIPDLSRGPNPHTPLTWHNTIRTTAPIGSIYNIISKHVAYVGKESMLHILKLWVSVHHAQNANLRSITCPVHITINHSPFLLIFANTCAS